MANSVIALDNYGARIELPDVPGSVSDETAVTIEVQLYSGTSLFSGVLLKEKTFVEEHRICIDIARAGFSYLLWDELYDEITRIEDGDYILAVIVYEGQVIEDAALSFAAISLLPEVIRFVPNFSVACSLDRMSIIIQDAENNWPGIVNLPFKITITSAYPDDLGVAISVELTNENLALPESTLQQGFEIEIPISTIDADLSVVPDSIYTVKLEVLQDDIVFDSKTVVSLIYNAVKNYIASLAFEINISYPKYEKASNLIEEYSKIIMMLKAFDGSDNGKVIEVLKYFKTLL